ncbi:MAG: hypothetical protein SOV40_07100 [Prevotella sp.]|nr:hypothetical protein [Bacteroidales bacterium]MDY2693390.1 hypothetical protein [Prevotella sp.]
MKNILMMAMCLMALASCKQEKVAPALPQNSQVDSLSRIIEQKDNEINDMMELFNEVEEGFRLISEAENRVNLVKNGEGADKAQRIRENIQFIQQRLSQNRELIAKLRQQLRESSIKGDQLKRTLDNLVKQLEEKDGQLRDLRAQLEAKDIHIAELDQTISDLHQDVDNLKGESQQKSNTINTQDKQLHTAWFVFGTKKELKEQGILDGGKVLQGNFNKNYFTKIDIRVEKEIKLYSKSAKLLTMHPSSSYTLARDSKNQYVLRINNPQIFWSTSKYLVIQVK